jgi:chromosome partitioning protein
VSQGFDVVLIDAPPALGMISLSVLNAANALVVPVRPASVDFASTAHFFTMLIQTYESFLQWGMPEPRFKFLKVLNNDMDESKSAHTAISDMMQKVFGTAMLSTIMKDSAEIDNAGARLQTVYELEGPITSRETHNRCKAYLNGVNHELELLVRRTWPSHHERLRKEGLL